MIKNRAFSLVEMVIATGIMVTLLVGLMSLYIYCFQLQDEARDVNNVTQLMRQEMEKLKAMSAVSFSDTITYYESRFFRGLPPDPAHPYEVDMSSLNPILTGKVRVEALYAKDTSGNDVTTLLNIRVVAGWVQRRTGKVIGGGAINAGSYKFNAVAPNQASSPFVLETAVVNH